MIQVLAQAASEGNPAVALILIFGGILLFGAWSANAAERKGYSRSTGWLLGGLLGLLGRIIVGVIRDKTITPAATATPPRSDLR
jgi:hypothetical protein